MIVRAWEEKDISAICQIEQESFSDPWSEGMFLDTLRFPVYHTFLVEDGGQVCGYGCLIILFEDAELANIAVAPTYRGKGVGNCLWRKCTRTQNRSARRECCWKCAFPTKAPSGCTKSTVMKNTV